MRAPRVFKSRNFYLLIALIFYFLLSPLIIDNQFSNFVLSVFMCLLVLSCVNMVAHNNATIIPSVVLASLVIAGYITVLLIEPPQAFYVLHYIIIVFFLLIMTISVIKSVASHLEITIDTLLGSICGYLLIGLTWSYLYLTIASISPNSFSYQLGEGTMRDGAQHFIYYSFVTLTTLGYGDIIPRSDSARAYSWLEAATGQIYLAVWISQLVALHIAQRFRK